MKLSTTLVIVALLLWATAWASEQGTYGAATAGPTKTSTPSPVVSTPADVAPPTTSSSRVTSPCALFTTAEVAKALGLEVAKGKPSKDGRYRSCTWTSLETPRVPDWREGDPVLEYDDGLVTITVAPATYYTDLESRITLDAVAKGAGGRQDLTQLAAEAFAIGASVSGVPIWSALTLHDNKVVAVEVSGADSKASLATVTDFLGRVTTRM